MSDSSQGDGWWQASDGKWYPPHLHPDYEAPAAPPEAPRQPVTEPYAPPATPAPAAAAAPTPTDQSAGSNKTPFIVGGAVAALALIVGLVVLLSGGGDDDEPVAAIDTEAPEVEPDDEPVVEETPTTTPEPEPAKPETETPAEPEPTAVPEPTTEEPEPVGGPAGTPEDPLPLIGSTFTHESFAGETWSGVFDGLIAVELGEFNDDAGACYLAVGRITAERPADDGVLNDGFSTPDISLIVDDALVEQNFSSCDESAAEAAGYQDLYDATITPGTSFPFFRSIFVEGSTSLPSAVVYTSDGDDSFYEATLITELPRAAVIAGPALENLQTGTTFEYVGFNDVDWSGELDGLVPVPLSPFTDEVGQCFALVSRLTPTAIPDGGVLSPEFGNPPVGVVSGGQFRSSNIGDCDSEALEQLGYVESFEAVATVGTVVPVFDLYFLPGDAPAPISEVIVGNPSFRDPEVFEPVILGEIPVPLPVPGSAGPDTLTAVGESFDYTDFSDSTWTGTVFGMLPVETNSFSSALGQCYVVVGSITPTSIADGESISDGFDTPSVTTIVDGYGGTEAFGDCDSDAVETAGYGRLFDAEVTLNTEYLFHAEVVLPPGASDPYAIVIGNADESGFTAFEAIILDALP